MIDLAREMITYLEDLSHSIFESSVYQEHKARLGGASISVGTVIGGGSFEDSSAPRPPLGAKGKGSLDIRIGIDSGQVRDLAHECLLCMRTVVQLGSRQ